jgi:hypothetical protein
VATLALVTWLPLLLLSWPLGLAVGTRVDVPLLRDPGFYGRYIAAVPLLVIAEGVVATSVAVQVRYLSESGLVPSRQRRSYAAVRVLLHRLQTSSVVQVVLVLVAYGVVLMLRALVAYSPGGSSWYRIAGAGGGQITPAGWWSVLVALPILVFLLLRWFWRGGVWAWFLYRVSRLDLKLTPAHPDRAGGLGFLAWGQASYGPVLAAISAILSGSFAAEVIYQGESLSSLKYHVLVFVALGLATVLAPLLCFSDKLARCRFQALLDFGTLVWRHDREFDERWIEDPRAAQKSLLGHPDASSIVDIGVAFEHVKRMRVLPFDREAALVLLVAALLPMVPFFATTIPLPDILQKLAVFMV